MQSERTRVQMDFNGLGLRRVQAAFDAGDISSDGGAVLLCEVYRRLGLSAKLAVSDAG